MYVDDLFFMIVIFSKLHNIMIKVFNNHKYNDEPTNNHIRSMVISLPFNNMNNTNFNSLLAVKFT